jgi:hypothetical protein
VKAEFITPLDTRRVDGSAKRELLAPFVFRSAILDREVTVPYGFQYDGPSTPLDWGGAGERPSCAHDFMYSNPRDFTRAQADAVFRELLKLDGMGAFAPGTGGPACASSAARTTTRKGREGDVEGAAAGRGE